MRDDTQIRIHFGQVSRGFRQIREIGCTTRKHT